MNDACFRKIQTLRLLPKAPARISVTELHHKLAGQGFDFDKRSLQRDLNALAGLFPIENDGNKDIPGWFWNRDAEKLELPEMEPAVALSFRMVKLFLERFMPPSTLEDLNGYFDYSERVLNGLPKNHLGDWSQKVALLSRNQPLLSPDLNPQILSSVYQAILSEKQLNAHYKPRGEEPRDYILNPLGIVVVDQVIYVVATLWEYTDVKQFALHRFKSAEVLETNSIPKDGFELQVYIAEGNFEYPVKGDPTLALKLKIAPEIAIHMRETKLSQDQIIEEQDGNLFLRATVKNTHQLRWWILSQGASAEVIEPVELRETFKKTVQQMHSAYHT